MEIERLYSFYTTYARYRPTWNLNTSPADGTIAPRRDEVSPL